MRLPPSALLLRPGVASAGPDPIGPKRPSSLIAVAIVIGIFLGAHQRDCHATQRKDDSIQIGVMTFNIRYNNPQDGPNAWPERKHNVAEVITDSRPDVVGLQEALPEQVGDLKSMLPEYAFFGAGRDDGENKGEQVAVMYLRDRWSVVRSGHFWLSLEPETPGSRSWDAAITRMVTWVLLEEQESETHVVVFNTHFDHRGPEARHESAKLLVERIPSIAGDTPFVLTGDFNCQSDSEPYQVLIEGGERETRLRDTKSASASDPIGPNSTWNGFREIADGRTIDFVFVSPRINVLRHETIDRQFGDRFPSDHLPVVALLEISSE